MSSPKFGLKIRKVRTMVILGCLAYFPEVVVLQLCSFVFPCSLKFIKDSIVGELCLSAGIRPDKLCCYLQEFL